MFFAVFFYSSFILPLTKCGVCVKSQSVFAAGIYFTWGILFSKHNTESNELKKELQVNLPNMSKI